MKTWIRRLALLALLVVLFGIGVFVKFDVEKPNGLADDADALAHEMMASVDADAWENTGALTWTYAGRYNHLWDRTRHFVRVRREALDVLVDINRKQGVATRNGVALTGAERDDAVQEAYAAWANDSFWLTAMNKAFDAGTTRARVVQDGARDALLVEYASGGVTPGDAYLWQLDDAGRPLTWQMWVSIIPIGGLSATWDEWVKLRTGAWVSTRHKIGPFNIEVTDLDGAATLSDLVPGADPFAALEGAASQPALSPNQLYAHFRPIFSA